MLDMILTGFCTGLLPILPVYIVCSCITTCDSMLPEMASVPNWTLTQDKDGLIQLLKCGDCVDYGYVKSVQHIMKENKSVLCVSSSKSVSLYKDVVLRKKNNKIDNTLPQTCY